jgi:hypothetical protein
VTIPLDTLNPVVPVVCRMLRTKTAFGSYESYDTDGGPPPWQTGESTTAVFWCLKTMDTAGPDDGFAHPSTCVSGRSCYRPDDD